MTMELAKYEWLLFDFDNTLADFNASSKLAFVDLLNGIGIEFAEELYPIYNKINHQCWDEREAGLISHEVLKKKRWELFFKQVGIDHDPLAANGIYFETIKTNPVYIDYATELLVGIQSHFKTMIITNGLSEVQNPRIEKLGIAKYFDHIVISDEIGTAKPQKAFFDHCYELMHRPNKSKVLVIGDTLKSDIKGGQNFGFDTCWYNYYKEDNLTNIKPSYTVDNLKSLALDIGIS